MGQVKYCRACQLRFINAGPADVCLTCDGILTPAPPLPRPPRPGYTRQKYVGAILEALELHD